MRILHVIQDLTPTAGTTVFCQSVCSCLTEEGEECAIATRADYSRSLMTDCDVVHMHAIWSMFNVRVMHDCLVAGKPFVASIHGGLMPRVFTKGRLKKWLAWHLLLKPLLKHAAAIHCTSEAEQAECEKLGLKGPFVIAPLGTTLPEIDKSAPQSSKPSPRTVVFLGRLSEEKGLLTLLDAWRMLKQEGCNARLILAGPDWRGYSELLKNKVAAEHIDGVEFTGPVYGEAKDKLYREADIFVLPSPMENFSMVVLDALAYGVPAIATKGTPWSELATENCGLWIDSGVEPLKHALSQLISAPAEKLCEMGENGRSLAARKYQWPAIAATLLSAYKQAVAK